MLGELFAKFAAGQVILPEIRKFCLFQYRVRPGEKGCLTTKSTKVTNCVFVPFVAIPGKRPPAEFCSSLGRLLGAGYSPRVYGFFTKVENKTPDAVKFFRVAVQRPGHSFWVDWEILSSPPEEPEKCSQPFASPVPVCVKRMRRNWFPVRSVAAACG